MSTRNFTKFISIISLFISFNCLSQTISLRSEISCGTYKAYLGWTNLANSNGTEIYSSPDGINFNLIQTIVGNSNFINVNQTHGTSIRYKVRNIIGSSFSNYSNTINLIFVCPVGNFRVLKTTCESIQLGWDNVVNATSLEIYRSTNSGPFVVIAQMAPNSTNYLNGSTINNTVYQYTIQARYAVGISSFTTLFSAISSCQVPSKPYIEPSNCGTISISWADYSADNLETAYEIYRSDTESGVYNLIGNVNANTLNYLDNSSLILGQTYFYKIKGIFNSFSSDLSPSVSTSLSMYTLNSGSWADPAIWSCGRVPTNLDEIIIMEGHIINLGDNEIANVKNIQNNGLLQFGSGANLTLNPQ